MMNTPTIIGGYEGELRCKLTHKNSSQQITTDAPKDNNGKGEAFSPTDLVAAALGSCMLTIIGIRANSRKLDIGEPRISILKSMQASPRKIDAIKIEIEFDVQLELDDRKFLESEARKCPVALSLSESIKQEINFKYI
ncbi:MAG: OsmC family protein [Vicingaceae bacterium]